MIMKEIKGLKGVLCFVLVLFFCVNLSAQEFFGGFVVGGVTSQVSGDSRGGYNKIGVVGGVFAGLNLSQDLEVQMELKYIQKGSLKERLN